jgi:hypothetical protein
VFLDLNNDGQLDPGDPSALTDFSGNYTLSGVAPGEYTVRVETFPGDVVTGPAPGTSVVDVGTGTALTSENFGLQQTSILAPVSPSAAPFGNSADPDSAVVEGIYQLVLGRAGDPASVAAWAARLEGGLSVAELARAFLSSAEYEGNVVQGDYQTFLGRSASQAEVNGWVSLLQAGWSEQEVAQAFLDSPEYSAVHAPDSAFVQSLYGSLLGRRAGDAEVNGWVQALNGGASRSAVVADFLFSAEADARAIESDYAAFLVRQASAPEVNGWLRAVQGGASLIDVAVDILGSQEFIDRA